MAEQNRLRAPHNKAERADYTLAMREETSEKTASSAAPWRHHRQTKLRDVAEYLDLSPSTVSRVMSGALSARAIPPETQQRILRAAEELHYRPNLTARSLRQQRSFLIGIIVPEIGEGYSSQILNGIEHSLLREGYFFFVVSHMHRENLLREYPSVLEARGVEGIIAVDTAWNNQPRRLPVITISGHQRIAGVTNIVLNHRRAATLALEHLAASGHREIAVIRGQPFSSDSASRWRAIRHTAKRLGLRIDPRLAVEMQGDEPTSEPGYVATQELLCAGPTFSAIFAFNDVSAIGAIRALREANLRVPEDVSVIGFDDIPSAAFQHPPLTTIRQPLQDMGALAVQHLMQRIAQRNSEVCGEDIVVAPELVVRGSTAQVSEKGR